MNQTAQRAIRAETEAFVDLYRAAADAWGSAHDQFEGVTVVWLPDDEDAAFSPVLNLSDARQKEATLTVLEQLGRERGMPRIGINGNPEIEDWASEGRAAALGYEPVDEEFFWARQLTGDEPEPELPDGATLELATPTDAESVARTLNRGHGHPDNHVRGRVFASAIGRPGWRHYLIRFDGEPAAASALYLAGDVAQLFITTTIPEFRQRGCQTYFIRRRLADGAAAGCNLAITQTVTGNASPRNMQRHGFELLYKRAIYGKRLA